MKRIYLVFIVAIVTCLLVACGPAASSKPAPIKVGYTLWSGYYPMLIAVEKGFFEKHGVAIEPKFYETNASQSADYAAGNLDGGAFVLGDVILINQTRPSKLILVTDFSNGADQVVATADIAGVADLKGKRIGVKFGTFGELLVRKMLEKNGMSINNITLVDVSPEELHHSLGSGIDAGHTFVPFTSQSLANGGHIIFDSADTPGLIPDVMAFNAKVVEKHPEALKAFVAAWFEAQTWWKENPAEATALLAKATGLKPEEISADGIKILDAAGNRAAFKPGTNFDSLHFTAEEYIKFLSVVGALSSIPNVDTLLDASFLQ